MKYASTSFTTDEPSYTCDESIVGDDIVKGEIVESLKHHASETDELHGQEA